MLSYAYNLLYGEETKQQNIYNNIGIIPSFDNVSGYANTSFFIEDISGYTDIQKLKKHIFHRLESNGIYLDREVENYLTINSMSDTLDIIELNNNLDIDELKKATIDETIYFTIKYDTNNVFFLHMKDDGERHLYMFFMNTTTIYDATKKMLLIGNLLGIKNKNVLDK